MSIVRTYFASQIRKNPSLVPERSGWYRWYASEDDVYRLLNSDLLKIDEDDIITYFEDLFLTHVLRDNEDEEDGKKYFATTDAGNGETYYGIYVGRAENLRTRIVTNHIVGGGDSQVRLNISCLVVDFYGDDDEDAGKYDYDYTDGVDDELPEEFKELVDSEINDFVDRLIVEFHTCDPDKLDDREYEEINDYITPLNVKQNDNRYDYPELADFLADLGRLHSAAGELDADD